MMSGIITFDILGLLKQAYLTAKPSKCFFAFRHLEFLPHIVGSGGYKIKSIQEIPLPTTKKEGKVYHRLLELL